MKNTILVLILFFSSIIPGISQDLAYISRGNSIKNTANTLNVDILSTINNTIHPRVILKNNLTGQINTYSIGDEFTYENDTLKVLHISDCHVSLVSGEKRSNVICKERQSDFRVVRVSGLSQFRIVNYEDLFTKSGDFKSDIDGVIKKIGMKYGVDPLLVKAVIKTESNFDPKAVSPKNAQGMMQLIPATARDYGVADPFNAKQNIEGGVKFLRDLIEFFKGDVDLVLAAYNAGPGTVMKYNYKVPPYPETKNYIQRVKKFYTIYRNRG